MCGGLGTLEERHCEGAADLGIEPAPQGPVQRAHHVEELADARTGKVTRVVRDEAQLGPVREGLGEIAAPDELGCAGPQQTREALVHVDQSEPEPGGLLVHGVGDLLVVEPPVAAARIALDGAGAVVDHLVLHAVDGGLRARRALRVDHGLDERALRAGQLVGEVPRRLHGLHGQRDAVGNTADHADLGLAVDPNLLHHVGLGQELEVPGVLRRVEAQKAQRRDVSELLEVHVVELNVHDEELFAEELARGLGVVALLLRDR